MLVNIGDFWPLMGKNCQQIVVYPKMNPLFSKIVPKQWLHACVWPDLHFISEILKYEKFSENRAPAPCNIMCLSNHGLMNTLSLTQLVRMTVHLTYFLQVNN